MQTDKFIIENDTWNLKFIMFYAAKTYQCILQKVEQNSVGKLVRDTRTNFCASYLLRIQSKF